MGDPIRILSVEDDPFQAEWIKQTIEQRISGAMVDQIASESEFVNKLAEISANPPRLILMDVMLRWADPSPNIPTRPADVKKGGIRRAGFRCKAKLRDTPATRAVPVVLYTVQTSQELAELEGDIAEIAHVLKDSDPRGLLDAVERLL